MQRISISQYTVQLCLFAALFSWRAVAQESAYFVTYDHYLEEPGSLELEYFSTFGTQRGGGDFHAFWGEFEYGATAWWTTEFYLDGQTTFGDSTIFTGFRWENRLRLVEAARAATVAARNVCQITHPSHPSGKNGVTLVNCVN